MIVDMTLSKTEREMSVAQEEEQQLKFSFEFHYDCDDKVDALTWSFEPITVEPISAIWVTTGNSDSITLGGSSNYIVDYYTVTI